MKEKTMEEGRRGIYEVEATPGKLREALFTFR